MLLSSTNDTEEILRNLDTMDNALITFVNPYSYYTIKDARLDSNFEYIFSDGTLLTALNNKVSKNKISRVSFDYTSFALLFFNRCKELNLRVAIIGAKSSECSKAVEYFRAKHSLRIEYMRSGYFDSGEDYAKCYNEINSNEIDIVIVGMGAPLQERFLIELKKNCRVKVGITCGGFISQSVNGDFYPKIIDKLNIRWLYRLITQPHVRKKFFLPYTKFMSRYLKEWLKRTIFVKLL